MCHATIDLTVWSFPVQKNNKTRSTCSRVQLQQRYRACAWATSLNKTFSDINPWPGYLFVPSPRPAIRPSLTGPESKIEMGPFQKTKIVAEYSTRRAEQKASEWYEWEYIYVPPETNPEPPIRRWARFSHVRIYRAVRSLHMHQKHPLLLLKKQNRLRKTK